MGTILRLKTSQIDIEDTASMRGARVRAGNLPGTQSVFDFNRQLADENVDTFTPGTDTLDGMLPYQDAVGAGSGSFTNIIAEKGLRLTGSSNGILYLPDAFKLNWEVDPSYMLSFWFTNVAPVSTATFAPFIGWANTNSDLKWAFGPWGNGANNTLILESASLDFGEMAATVGQPQNVTAFVKRTGSGTNQITVYKNGSKIADDAGTYKADPTSAAGRPRIGRTPSLSGTYSGTVHNVQVAKIPTNGITDEAGWALAEYDNFVSKYTA